MLSILALVVISSCPLSWPRCCWKNSGDINKQFGKSENVFC